MPMNQMTDLIERLARQDFNYLTLECAHGETYSHPEPVLYGHGTYKSSSVLAGRPLRVYLESWKTFDEARGQLNGAKIKFEDIGDDTFTSHVPIEEMISHIPKNDYDLEAV
jgi:hypothetical protein